MMPTLVITRPKHAAKKTAQSFHKAGFKTFIEPLMDISHDNCDFPELPTKTPVIITSQHALFALAENSKERAFPLIIVGSHSTAMAKELGFQNILFTASNSQSLTHYILEHYTPSTNFVYLRGEVITANLTKALAPHHISEHIVYKASPHTAFSKQYLDASTQVDGVVFYSQRTLAIFHHLLDSLTTPLPLEKWTCFCLSPQIADFAQNKPWKSIIAPSQPDSEALLALIRDFNFD